MKNNRILEILWRINDTDLDVRMKSSSDLIEALKSAEDSEVEYVVTRMLKGLLSSNKCSRQGFASVLTEFLRLSETYNLETISEMADKILVIPANANKQETKDFYFARIFFILVLCKSGLLQDAPSDTLLDIMNELFGFMDRKKWLPEICSGAIEQIIKSVSIQSLTDVVEQRVSSSFPKDDEIFSANDILLGITLVNQFNQDKLPLPESISRFQILLTDSSMVEKLTAPLLASSILHPQVHSVWKALLDFLLDNYHTSGSLEYLNSFWSTVMEQFLASSPRRKFFVFHVFDYLMESSPDSHLISVLFSEKFLTTLADSIKFRSGVIHHCAVKSAQVVESSAKLNNNLCVPMLSQFSRLPFKFDARSRFPLTKNLTDLLDTEVIVKILKENNSSKNISVSQIDDVFALLKHPEATVNEECVQTGLHFLMKHSFVSDCPEDVKELANSRFITIVGDLLRKPDVEFSIFEIIDAFMSKFSKKFDAQINQFRKDSRKIMKKLSPSAKCMLNESQCESSKNLVNFLLLLQLSEPEEATTLLTDLTTSLTETLKQNDQDSVEQFVIVSIDIILSLLSKPTSLYRKFSQSFVRSFSEFVTESSVEDLIAALQNDNGAEMDEDDIEPEDDDDEDSEIEMEIDNTSNSRKQVDEQEEEEAEESEEEIFLKDVASDDEEIAKYEAHLASYMKLKTDAKNAKKEAETQMVNFKIRIIDLVDVLVRSRSSDPMLMSLVVPMLHLLGTCKAQSLQNKVSSSLDKLLSLKPSVEIDGPISESSVALLLMEIIDMCKSSPSAEFLEKLRRTVCFGVRIILKADQENGTVWLCDELVLPLIDDCFEKKRSKLNLQFFTGLFDSFPVLGWKVLPRLSTHCQTSPDSFSQFEAFLAIEGIIRHKSLLSEDEFRENLVQAMPNMTKALSQGFEAFAGKPKRLKHILRVCQAVIELPLAPEAAVEDMKKQLMTVFESVETPDNAKSAGFVDTFKEELVSRKRQLTQSRVGAPKRQK